jgi:hypothetical protein
MASQTNPSRHYAGVTIRLPIRQVGRLYLAAAERDMDVADLLEDLLGRWLKRAGFPDDFEFEETAPRE